MALVFAASLTIAGPSLAQQATANQDQVAAGEYLVRAGGCVACHTDVKNDGVALAGGRALKTPFGTFYSANITPDRETGIGAWSDADFINALRHGVRPDGQHYFPVFPYTSYTRMSDADMLAIKAYLFSQPAVAKPNSAHDVAPPFGWRWTMSVWKALFFEPGAMADDAGRDPTWNRGAYLVEALAHCGECHTPRNFMGAVDAEMHLAGTTDGPNGELVPNITPHETGIGDWSEIDIVTLLRDGLKPNFDDVQGSMAEAIEDGLKYLSEDDLQAIAVYIKSVRPIDNKVERQSP